MITFRITAKVNDDRRVVLTLPPEVPTGHSDLVVNVETPEAEGNQAQSSPSDKAESRKGHNGNERDRYPLRGSVVRYEQPTEPVAEADWEALR